MSKKRIYFYSVLIILLFFIWIFLNSSSDQQEEFSEKVKISLRDVGHQLLLVNNDTTSLVLPVVMLNNSKYELSFQEPLSMMPDNLVSIVQKSFEKANLPNHYRVEAIQCIDEEVAYSYEMNFGLENTIIPCLGRELLNKCYTVQVRFIKKTTPIYNKQIPLYLICIIGVIFLLDYLIFSRKSTEIRSEKDNAIHTSIGSFLFYPEQNKLVKEAIEINLSKKECELLAIFVANPNQIIKRDELTKKVWEDNGVFVGRSLDTYISKLRKKLKDDTSVKITNVHGVGYKLEIYRY
ncbi:winged helix-turn-helix domain-containing protein [Aquimarina sp. 2201CG5-10]|uniref:winged helix-turn-helix domain-containing protein n=1 Tax=Aquimarina callyspongiae TaxID=3098150 RepID=UPI002AB5C229|nr:winged helix-turn-helix domain-containing protein [Aquimarina sp. 2201CG5-10]MDY8135952.1 winged helix-turn-helix domain-containing protein [Aquimarina sp. 2201CG5-10]